MRHYVLTRSSFAPEVGLDEIRFRLELLRRICVPALRAQTSRHWGWIVLVDPRDPMLKERTAILESANAPWLWIRSSEGMTVRGGPDAPRGPWARYITASRSGLSALYPLMRAFPIREHLSKRFARLGVGHADHVQRAEWWLLEYRVETTVNSCM